MAIIRTIIPVPYHIFQGTATHFAWWRHQMEISSTLLPIRAGIHRSPVNSPHKSQWRGSLVFSLICAWMNGWVDNREAGDFRRHRSHYDVTVMEKWIPVNEICGYPNFTWVTVASLTQSLGARITVAVKNHQEALLLTWFNSNPSIAK